MIKNVIARKNIFVWILAIIPILFFYNRIIFNPNSALLNDKGDAIKNYYTYKYYIDKNKSFVDFNGMNYPYGENFIFTDSQPPLSFTLKLFSNLFPSIKNIDIAIMHLFIFLSFIFSIFLFFKIFEFYKLNFFFSIIGAWAIVLLSPQFMRIYGHYSLSYLFVYPLVLYFLINTKNSLKSNTIIFATTVFGFFMHPYMGLSLFLFTSLTGFFKFIFTKKYTIKQFAINFSLQSLLPILIFYIVLIFIDTHTNRSTNPAGLYYYHSYLKTIFIASFEPVKSLYKTFITFNEQPFEGIAYIGIIANLSILLITFFLIKKLFIKKFIIPIDKTLLLFLFSAFLLLLFSFGVPHVYGFPKLLDIIPNLRQFRGLGRFSWFFYYIINIIAVIILHYFYTKYSTKKLISYLFIFLLVVFFSESIFFQKSNTKQELNFNNKFNLTIDNNLKNAVNLINIKNYQAIIPLPFYHLGSEDFGITGSHESVKNSMLLSYHLNLPILGSMGSRTSINETKKSLSILLPNFYKKSIINDIPNKKDFLIVLSKGDKTNEENFILSKSKLILKTNEFSLYSIRYDDLFEYKKYKQILLNKYKELNTALHKKNGFIFSDTSKYFRIETFNNLSSKIKFVSGTKAIKKTKPTVLFKIKAGELSNTKNYILSFWAYNKGYGRTSFQVIWEEHDEINNKSNWHYSTDCRFSKTVKDNWSLIKFKFKPLNNKTSYNLYFPGRNNGVDSIYVDNIMLREADLDVYKKYKKSNTLMFNNFFIKIN